MTSVLCDVTLWLEHAKEVRALCEMISDLEEKEQMMVVAAGFDRIAELAKEQAMLEEPNAATRLVNLRMRRARKTGEHTRMPPRGLGAPASS